MRQPNLSTPRFFDRKEQLSLTTTGGALTSEWCSTLHKVSVARLNDLVTAEVVAR